MSYTIEFIPSAERQFKKLSKDARDALQPIIDSLANNPFPSGVASIAGVANCYRVADEKYRIVYEVNEGKLIILVCKIGHRRDVYNKIVPELKKLLKAYKKQQ